MRFTAVLLIGLMLVGFFALPSAALHQSEELCISHRPYVTLAGAESRIEKNGYFRIDTMEKWIALWLEHTGAEKNPHYGMYYNTAGVPEIDFEKCLVIAIFGGSGWNSAGKQSITYEEGKNHILFRFDDKSFQTAGPDGGGKRVTPFGFFVFPASDKPVIVEENVQGLIGGKPVWKERARI
jgi:hypothetical protein